MQRLYSISGYLNDYETACFDEGEKWEGELILEDNNWWFQGIVRNMNESDSKDQYICGICYPDKVISLLKVTSDGDNPLAFRCFRMENGYEGEYSSLVDYSKISLGHSRIIISPIEDYKANARKINSGWSEWQELVIRVSKFSTIGPFKDVKHEGLMFQNSISEMVLGGFTSDAEKALLNEWLEWKSHRKTDQDTETVSLADDESWCPGDDESYEDWQPEESDDYYE